MEQVAFWIVLLTLQEEETARGTIREKDLREHVEALAADAWEGRNAGTSGAREAAQYIADRFQASGLRAPFEGSYFQTFRFEIRSDSSRRLFPEEGETANVIGIVDGTDPEAIVIGAHYDHVGKKGQADPGRRNHKHAKGGDDIWNGADDNASGTSMLLELAQAFSTLRPKRTLIFVAFGAEEHHLLGSTWYCNHPVVPLDKTALMLNLDMVGRTKLQIHGAGTAEGLRATVEKVVADAATILEYGDVRDPASDHYPFFEARVPSVFFFTGFHEDYHESTDHADKLDYPSMEKIGRAAFDLVRMVSEAADPLRFRPPLRLEILVGGWLTRDHPALEKQQGGLWIAEVLPDSPAASAGLREGDILVEVNGQKLPQRETKKSFRRMFESLSRGTTVSLIVLRATGKVELKLELK